ncbi:MAG: ATP-binding cassette domain-containing protein [Ferruginibacter sp.]
MQIKLEQVDPVFIEEEKKSGSDIWKKTIAFHPAEWVHIIAPSGSGKTSLIHFLYGLRKDYQGRIQYNDTDIAGFDTEAFAGFRQQHISIVFQDLRLFTGQTVFQNIEIKRLLQPWHPQSRIEEMARRLGIHNKLEKMCSTCSYGEQQRIAIIRALQQPFDFLLLDEPFSHLDDNNRKKAMELMEEEAAARKAAIILADLKKLEFFHAHQTLQL